MTMSKNNTYNIDDLLKMPDIASEFDNTAKLNNLIDSTTNFNNLFDNTTNNTTNISNDLKQETKTNLLPSPPPIPKWKEETTAPLIDSLKTIEKQLVQETITCELDEIDDMLANQECISDINKLEEDINELIRINAKNEYYENIIEEQDIKNDSQFTRIYFDEEEIENKLNKISNSKQLNIEEPIMAKNHNEEQIAEIEINSENNISSKRTAFQRWKGKINEFKHNLINVEKFYKFEYTYTRTCWFISFFLLTLSIVIIGLSSYAIYGINKCSPWLYFPVTIFVLGCIAYNIFTTIKIKSMQKELKNHGYLINKDNATTSITKIYKSLITSNYYLNWGAASIYVISGLLILMTFIVVYFINLSNRNLPMPTFGNLTINRNNNSPLIVVWTFASMSFMMMFLQLIYNPLNIYRKNQIEIFYGKTLISEELIEKYRKNANRKGIAIFIVSTLVISMIILLIYFILKKRSKRS